MIGKNIKYYRKLNNLSQEELAENVGVTRAYISQLELGKSTPSTDLINKIADCFKVSASVLSNQNMVNPKEISLLETLKLNTQKKVIMWQRVSDSALVSDTFMNMNEENGLNFSTFDFYYYESIQLEFINELSRTIFYFLCSDIKKSTLIIYERKKKTIVLDNPALKNLIVDLINDIETIESDRDDDYLSDLIRILDNESTPF